MRVLHVIPSLARSDGGPARAVVEMVRALGEAGVEAEIATTDYDGPGKRCAYPAGEKVLRDGCAVRHFPLQYGFYKISLSLWRWLRHHVDLYDIVHVHALFSFAPWAASQACRARHVPYIIRPLGVLNPWGMEQRRPWLKSWSFACVDRSLLDHAAAIHYTSRLEADEAARLGLRARPVIIPLGMHFPASLPRGKEAFVARHPEAAGRPLVLFVGRLDPVKGLDLLLHAFKLLRETQPRVLLAIAGKGDDAYEQRLRLLAAELGLAGNVLWTGFLDAQARQVALAASDVFVLPSRSENFGIALLEAMAAGCACVATPGVGLAHDAGNAIKMVPPLPEAVAASIDGLLADAAQAASLGAMAKALAYSHFSAQSAGRSLIELYKHLTANIAPDKTLISL